MAMDAHLHVSSKRRPTTKELRPDGEKGKDRKILFMEESSAGGRDNDKRILEGLTGLRRSAPQRAQRQHEEGSNLRVFVISAIHARLGCGSHFLRRTSRTAPLAVQIP
jgi:hypothetical protein